MATDNSARFRTIVSTILQVPEDKVTDKLSRDKAATWDSLNHISLISALEQEFNLTLAADKLDKVRTIAALKAVLAEHGIEM